METCGVHGGKEVVIFQSFVLLFQIQEFVFHNHQIKSLIPYSVFLWMNYWKNLSLQLMLMLW